MSEQKKTAIFDTLEMEQALIGACFRDNSIAVTVELEPEDFGSERLGFLWRVARAVVTRGDIFTVGLIIKQSPDLEAYIRALVDWGTGVGKFTIEQYVKAIKDGASRRRIQGLAESLAEVIADQEHTPEKLLSDFVSQASVAISRSTAVSKRAVAQRVAESLKKPPIVYSTGISGLDNILAGGLWPSKCIGVGARKKVGKTVLGGTISHNLNRAQVPHLYLSWEMTDEEVEQRNIARELQINSIQFLTRNNPNLMAWTADYATSVPDSTWFEHCPGETLDGAMRRVFRAILNLGIKGAIFDYLQLVGGMQKGQTEEFHLRNVAQTIANECKAKGLWAIILSQTNQDGNTRGGEGLKLACDVHFNLIRAKDDNYAALEMTDSRFLMYANLGEIDDNGKVVRPGMLLNAKGPFFEDPEAPSETSLFRT